MTTHSSTGSKHLTVLRPAAAAAFVLIAACLAKAEVNTKMEWQVSPALQENWSSSLTVQPGQSVDLRLRVSYIGTQSPLGLGAVAYHPTVSNWDATGTLRDTVSAFPIGFGHSIDPADGPFGSVPDGPGKYGRIFEFARSQVGTNGFPALTGYNQVHNGVSYLRVSPNNNPQWNSGPSGPNSTGGIDTSQWTPGFRPTFALPFDTRLTNIVVFKFNITLSPEQNLRTLTASIPPELYSYYNTANGVREGRWIANTTEASGSIRGGYLSVPATINVVPSPGVACTGVVGLCLAVRRRR